MRQDKIAIIGGVLVCILILIFTLIPVFYIDSNALNVYYRVSGMGPPIVALLAVISVIALISAYVNRSDPVTIAGVVLVLSILMTLIGFNWAFSVSSSLVGGLTTIAIIQYHRWVFAVTTLSLPFYAGWYAYLLLKAKSP